MNRNIISFFLSIAALITGYSASAQTADVHKAIVNVSACYLYSQPSYESSLETQELLGTVVEILERDRYWVKISTPQPYIAWTNALSLIEVSEARLEEYETQPKFIVTTLWDRVFSKADAESVPVCDIVLGDRLIDSSTSDPKSAFLPVTLPDGRNGWVRSEAVTTEAEWAEQSAGMTAEQKADKVVNLAMRMNGIPYLWGGMTPKGLDCSGLVRLCYLMVGVNLPRNASQMFNCLPEISAGSSVNDLTAGLEKGDLLFFGKNPGKPSHVGIYIGDGRFIHASQLVRVSSLRKEDSDYYENAGLFIAARRP